MANEPAAVFLTYLIAKLKSEKTIVASDSNIIIGESADIHSKKAEFFPRLEIIIKKLNGGGYIDQRNVDEGFRVTVSGYVKREENDTTDQDMYDVINFARETKKIVYKINTDKRTGSTVCDGFEQVGGFNEIFLGYELPDITKMSMFIFEFEAEILLPDTYTNN